MTFTPPNEAELRLALANRTIIGQAMGILMERYKMTAEEAFQRLSTLSQNTNSKLIAIATELTNTGEWPYEQS